MLPCGAGKSLVGVSAACRIKKSCLCLATNAVSVDQWAFQFKLWSTIKDEHISRFTSDNKEKFRGMAGVVVTTYNMVAFGGKRSEDSEKIIEEIRNREWGLLLMDEVGYPLVIFEVFNIKYFRSSHMSMFFFLFVFAGPCCSCTYVQKGHQHYKISLQAWSYWSVSIYIPTYDFTIHFYVGILSNSDYCNCSYTCERGWTHHWFKFSYWTKAVWSKLVGFSERWIYCKCAVCRSLVSHDQRVLCWVFEKRKFKEEAGESLLKFLDMPFPY